MILAFLGKQVIFQSIKPNYGEVSYIQNHMKRKCEINIMYKEEEKELANKLCDAIVSIMMVSIKREEKWKITNRFNFLLFS